MAGKLTLGADFGSASVRVVIADAQSGEILSSAEADFPRWKKGLYQHPDGQIYRQHPLDHTEAFEECVKDALEQLSSEQRDRIAAIGIDTTGSTPVPVNREGIPLALTEGLADNENAMFWLWKDHSAAVESRKIDRVFKKHGFDRYMGDYNAEWFWAKILHCVRTDKACAKAAYTWVEHSDWMVGELTGNTDPASMYHNACANGHKAYWHSSWNGLPSAEMLGVIDSYLKLVAERFGRAPEPATVKAGYLSEKWKKRLQLTGDVLVSGSALDAHAGAVGAGIRDKRLVAILGTSAVEMLVKPLREAEHLSIGQFAGQAENATLPGYVSIESGQSSFGDIFAWLKEVLLWPSEHIAADPPLTKEQKESLEKQVLSALEKEAQNLPDDPFPIALDWFNGRRYPKGDPFARAAVTGLNLASEAPVLYRSLAFGAVCGLKRIVDGFEEHGLEIKDVVAVGGISRKSPYLMQMMADVLGKEITIVQSDQTCALGAAIYAACAAGIWDTIEEAVEHMASKSDKKYMPGPEKKDLYAGLYRQYLALAGK